MMNYRTVTAPLVPNSGVIALNAFYAAALQFLCQRIKFKLEQPGDMLHPGWQGSSRD